MNDLKKILSSKPMQTKSKTAITILLVLALTIPIATLPIANAHEPAWTIPTYAYIVASPDRVGVNQPIALIFWLNWVPPGAGGIGGDRWRNLNVEITKPNGVKETLGPFTSDPIGGGYSAYTPDQIGTYTVTFTFPGQVPSMIGPTGVPSVNRALWDFINDTFLPSNATTTFTVQQEQLQLKPDYPLPTNYWTRPIEGQNTQWTNIASNWLGNEPGVTYNTQPYGAAPNTPHVMWTKPLQDGGVVGGNLPGVIYYQGDSYEMRFNNPMIIHGRLYYDLPLGSGKTGGGYNAVDLRTGEQIWWANWTTMLPAIGQIYDYESINQHGVLPTGILWRTTGSTMMAYDSLTATWLFNLTGVPSGTNYHGPKGEILRYVLNATGKWLALWNNTDAHGETLASDPNDRVSTNYYQWRPNGKNIDASKAYSWNVSLPTLPTGSAITYVAPEDFMLCNTPTQALGGNVAFSTQPYTITAINLKPASRGEILWTKQYDPPANNLTRQLGPVDPLNRIFTTIDKETREWSGYSLANGEKVWGPVGENRRGYTYYDSRSGGAGSSQAIYQGKLYHAGFNGIVYCYDTKDGKLLWEYGTGEPGNSTFAGLENVWGYNPTFLGGFADGKVFTMTQEHSVNTPIYKGALIRALNATTGQEIWTLPGFASSTSFYSRLGAIADGYLAYFNAYDGQVYSIGKGPSKTTVTVSPKSTTEGSKILVEGTVTDVAAGTKQNEPAARFPNGVPAVSDASMSEWMQYVYMQKPKPTNVTGVKVEVTATDPNGNTQIIGEATSNSLGNFAIDWTPPVPGTYTITATFKGTEGYYGSEAGTAFVISEATSGTVVTPTPTPTPQTTGTVSPTETPLQTATPSPSPYLPPPGENPTTTYIAIAAAVVVVLAVAAALILRRHK